MISYNYLASPGQLANQMFKYAALKGIASNLEQEFMIPNSYKLLEYKPLLKILNRLKIIDHRSNHNHLLIKYFKLSSLKNMGYQKTDNFIKEKGFEFDETLFNSKEKNFDIWGFFQTEKYFVHIRQEILSDFEFKNSISSKTRNIYNKLDNPISLHVRRGDYLTNPNHHPLELSYYKKSLEYFGNNSKVLIFTDDLSWCKQQNLFKQKNFIFADDFTNSSESIDLSLMTMCEKHIIANSSFSWWGAWLSSQKQVIAPKYWFKNSEKYSKYNTKDLLPKNWIQIEN